MGYENKIDEALHYMDINRYEKSNEALFEALTLRPNDGFTLHLIGKNYFNLFNYVEAIKFCKESLEQGYSMESNTSLMGTIYMGMEDYVQSEKCYLEALRLSPQNARVLAAYGLLMLRTHHQKKAVQLLEEAMRLDPNDEWVIHCWFLYYSANNKLNEQLVTLESFIENSDDEKRKILKIAFYNEHKMNYKEALSKLKEAYLLDPTDQGILEHLKAIEVQASPFFIPQHLIVKIGGPGVCWFAFMALILLFNILKVYTLVYGIAIFYFVLVLYTWISLPLVKAYYKRKHR